MSEKSLKERFQEKLQGSRWTGSTNNIGYPKMKVDGEMVLGSHVALRLAGRKVPTGGPAGGKIVMHKDNNKLNLSPSNLAVGTHKANLKQMRDEGRDRPRGVHQEPDEKVAIDIRRAVLPEMGSVMGKYLNPAQVAANPLASGLARGRPHLLVEKPLSELRAMAGNMRDFAGKPELIDQAANALQKNTRRHELTHYLRGKAGKMEGVGQPGLRNVLRTGREELIAYTKGVDAFDKMGPQYVSQAAKGVIPGAVASVREAYPQGVAHAALGGTLKPVRDLAQRFGLMKQGGIDILKFAFKLQGHTEFQGIPIAIENRKGSVRKGTDKDGKPWRTVMKMPYGFIKGSKGADGEDIDCYVGPHKDAPNAYVVHQRKSDGTGYDEDKILFGLRNKEEATKGYLAHYNSDKFLGPVKEVPVERLKEMLSTGKKLEKISTSLCARVLRRG